jgi:hypothetical protein
MHGFASNVLSCEERARLEQEFFQGAHTRQVFVLAAAFDGSGGSTFRSDPSIDPKLSDWCPCMTFLLFPTEV